MLENKHTLRVTYEWTKKPTKQLYKGISCLRKDYSSEADKSILGIISEQPVCGFCYFIAANTDCYFSCYVMLYYNKKNISVI